MFTFVENVVFRRMHNSCVYELRLRYMWGYDQRFVDMGLFSRACFRLVVNSYYIRINYHQ